MTAQTPLKVVMTDFDKLNQLYNQTERVWLKENEIFIDIYPTFAPTRIDKILSEIFGVVDQIQKLEIEDMLEPEFMDHVIMTHIIREFTTLDYPEDFEAFTVDKLIYFMQHLTGNEYYEKISLSFPQDEIQKVYERMTGRFKQIAEMSHAQKMINEIQQQFPILNEEVARLQLDNA